MLQSQGKNTVPAAGWEEHWSRIRRPFWRYGAPVLFLLPGGLFRRNDHVSGHEKEEPAASPGGSGGHIAPGHQRGAVPAGGRRLPLRCAPKLCVPQREAVLPLRQGRPQAGRHPAGGEVLLLRHRPGPGGGGEVHHPVPQRHRLWAGAGAGGRRREARRPEGPGGAVQPGEPESLEKEIAATWNSVCVLELEIEHLTGKEAKELRNRGAGQ